jgi:UDP-3-O-[3-hydroxymyristoyl] glucosamine N-acyltransferase
MEWTLKELAEFVGGTVAGDGAVRIRGVGGLRDAREGDITFLANPKYEPLLASTRASAVIVAPGVRAPIPALVAANPDLAFARVAERFNGAPPRPAPGIHPSAVVAPDVRLGREVAVGAGAVVESGASIGDRTVLYPQVYVGHGAAIGSDCVLYPQVVVREKCVLGARVILHSGAVVGADGFGYATEGGVHHKIPQVGIVVVEDDVEIGANVTVDRARFGRTVIGRGTKIDNLVQIGHNVQIGEHCLIVAQAGISGSTRLGRGVVLGGQAGLAGHLEVGDGAAVTAQAGVSKNVPPGAVVSGEHAVDMRVHLRQMAALAKLPEALAEIKRLRREVEDLRRKLPSGSEPTSL